jgi:UDP-N-acetylglucosamine 2-epimerase
LDAAGVSAAALPGRREQKRERLKSMFEKQKRITSIGDTQPDALATASLKTNQQKHPDHPIWD